MNKTKCKRLLKEAKEHGKFKLINWNNDNFSGLKRADLTERYLTKAFHPYLNIEDSEGNIIVSNIHRQTKDDYRNFKWILECLNNMQQLLEENK